MRCCAVLLLMLGMFGCGESARTGSEPPPAPVSVVQATVKPAKRCIDAVGFVKASNAVSIRSQVDGVLMKIHFLDGQDIQSGERLFTIDPTLYRLDQQQQIANEARLRENAEEAARKFQRYKTLYEKGVVSREEYDAKATAATTTRQAVEAQQAQVGQSAQKLGYTQILAPYAGTLGSALLDEGNLVRSNQDSLVVLNTISPADVSFSVPQRYLQDIRQHFLRGNVEVFAAAPGQAGPPEHGDLTFVDNAIDRTTGMVGLKARFDNRQKALWPGQFVTVSLVLDTIDNAIQVPATALQQGPDGPIVFVVADGIAQVRAVTPGLRTGDEVVIDSGLTVGETVVTEGHLRLYPGARVSVVPAPDKQAGDRQAGEGTATTAAGGGERRP